VLVATAFVLGLVVGSFLNVVAHRVPQGLSIVRPGSRCPHCGHEIRPWENVPVLSWLALRGRCSGCAAPISVRYPLVELVTGLLFAAAAWRYGLSAFTPLAFVLVAGLLAASLIDFEHRFIPDAISLGGLAFGLVATPVAMVIEGIPATRAIENSLGGAVLGGGLLWIVGFLHARVSVALGRSFEHWPGEGESLPTPRDADYWLWFPGLGLGDVKLMAAIGAFLGPGGVLETVVAAALLGLLLGVVQLLAERRGVDAPFGFGPALAAGALLVALVPHAPLVGLLGP
jgi:leader peptidase (prepilin peptidase)/N-methyltransferase